MLAATVAIGPAAGAEDAAAAKAEDEAQAAAAVAVAVQLQDAFAHVAEQVFPSVIGIGVYARDPEGAPAESPAAREEAWRRADEDARRYPGYHRVGGGSGVLVDPAGYALSCHHVLLDPATGEPAELIDVELAGGLHVRSRLVGSEPTVDLAVIKVEWPQPLPAATIGDSDRVRVGHWAIALGDPGGVERTFAAGTVAARPERDCYQDQRSRALLQTAVTLHPEAYGGPLVDIHGRVIGIDTRRATFVADTPELPGSEYAIPINLAMTLYEALRVAESRHSPWLGISVLPLNREIRQRLADAPLTGVYIDGVFDPSPASAAGVQVGDVLVAMDGERLLAVQDFQRWLYLYGIGRTIELELSRAGETLRVKAPIVERPASATPN
jgi:serine protease Do